MGCTKLDVKLKKKKKIHFLSVRGNIIKMGGVVSRGSPIKRFASETDIEIIKRFLIRELVDHRLNDASDKKYLFNQLVKNDPELIKHRKIFRIENYSSDEDPAYIDDLPDATKNNKLIKIGKSFFLVIRLFDYWRDLQLSERYFINPVTGNQIWLEDKLEIIRLLKKVDPERYYIWETSMKHRVLIRGEPIGSRDREPKSLSEWINFIK